MSFIGPTFNHISRLLMRYNIKTVGLLPRKVNCLLWHIKDDLGLKIPGINSIHCGYSKVYIGHTGYSTETRMKEHHHHIRLYHLDKSAMAEHNIIWVTAFNFKTPV